MPLFDVRKNVYQCPECGFHYADKELAEQCEAWCKEHGTCNIDLIEKAVENAELDAEI